MSSTTTRSTEGPARTVLTLGVAAGFAALAFAAWHARGAPTTGYELSIYAATPEAVWAGVGVAGALALVTALAAPTRGVRHGGLALGASTVVVVGMLPLLRNYRYRGSADSLTHLGWARDVVTGALEPSSLFYPAVHVIAVQLRAAGLSLERALMLTVVVFLVSFLVFVPLVARACTGDPWVTTLAAISAWMLIPLNHVGSSLMVFPTTQALFLLPGLLLVFMLFLRRRTDHDDSRVGLVPGLMSRSPLAPLLVLFGVGMLLVHPQQAANVLILFAAGAVLQGAVRYRRSDHPIADHRPLFLQTGVLGLAFLAWTVQRERFVRAVEGTISGLLSPSLGSVDEMAQRSGSLAEIGVGLETLFVRLFLVALVYSLLSGGLVLALTRGKTGASGRTRVSVAYLVAGLVPLTGVFALYFFNTPTLGFRQVGLLMVFCTILGAIALALISRRLSASLPAPAVRTVVGVVLAAAVTMSMLTMFASPFVFKSSSHVSEQQWEGHADAFDRRGEEMYYSRLELSAPVYRYGDGILGVETSDEMDYTGTRAATAPPSNFNDGTLPRVYENARYLTVTRADYEREVRLYNEFRHTEEGFRRLPRQKGLNRVVSNGEFRLYVVNRTA